MSLVTLPPPVVRAPARAGRLERDLAEAVSGEVRFDAGSRALYATDASNYRQVPIGVVIPRTLDDVVATVRICQDHQAPILSRGGGTSLAGECCNVAVLMDFSKYLTRIESVDERKRLAVVEPGIVLDQLNAHTREHGRLVFGPKPATHNHCTIGGMLGNNSCGSTAQWSGTTAANVTRLEILTYDGRRMWVGPMAGMQEADIVHAVTDLRDRTQDLIRGFPQLPRRISGYNLPALLPENGENLAQALVGTESTCVTILRAELKLLPEPAAYAMVLLGFDDIVAAARAVPEVNSADPFVLEGLDDKLIRHEVSKHLHPDARRMLPEGSGWLMVQFGADTAGDARDKARRLADRMSAKASVKVVDDAADQAKMFAIRESGLGATAKIPGEPDTWPGWEDAAVPPERLGDYLAEFAALQKKFGYQAATLYGHFGHGCVHTRIPFDLDTADGVRAFRKFVEQAADLVVKYGGSLSGEHGDGQARGELLERMYGRPAVEAFEQFKAIFDPDNRMNPGKVVRANPLDGNLRHGSAYAPVEPATVFHYPEDEGRFARAADRCVGVGKCRRHEPDGGVMCPSYQVTREEQHSTRGRARLLFEMLQGDAIQDGWRSEAVDDALDLCLACKGCKSDCPVNVDMATYKAEFLHHHYAGRVRPRDHYSLGWLPAAAYAAGFAPGGATRLARTPLAKRLAGIDPARSVPPFSAARFTRWASRRPARPDAPLGEVVLWPDTFTMNFAPHIGAAAIGVLEAAGFSVTVPRRPVCCGLTWISTGQLSIAQRVLRRTLSVLAPYLHSGTPIVSLEPSCGAVLRSDAGDLLGSGQEVQRLRSQTRTLAELLVQRAPDFRPRLTAAHGEGEGVKAIVQTHCHQHAIFGTEADTTLFDRIGLHAEVLDSGCCGLAGNFGMTRAHREVSFACAEQVMLPAVRDADPATVVLADGFSCRKQIEDGQTGRRAAHLAEVLLAAVRGTALGDYPEHFLTHRPGDRRTTHSGGAR